MNTSNVLFRRPALVALFFVAGLLFLLLPLFRPQDVSLLFLFIGRLHPLILHFPIVLIILALLFEVAGRFFRFKAGDGTVLVLLIAAALSALVAIAAGFFLFASGDYAGNLMERHFWAGTITGAFIFFTLGLFYLHRATSRYYNLYFAALLLSNASVGYASHLGGSITHGEDYLTEHLQFVLHSFDEPEAKPESEMRVFDDMLLPVFESKCMSCHNDQRAKGDFVMSSFQKVTQGGRSDAPSVMPGAPAESELFRRVVLPEGHEDRMPPEGKTPMHESEIALLKYWIASGASDSLRVADARSVDSIQPLVDAIMPELVKYRRRSRLEKVKLTALEEQLQALAARLDVTITRDSLSDGNLFVLAMKFPPAPFTNEQFRELSPYFEAFSKLSLASSGIDDAGLYYIGQMVNVRELYLQKTKLDGSGVVYLQNLPNLEVLNLSFTGIDDKSALDLLKIPRIREVYLYRTQTSMQVIEALRKYRPSARFLLEEGPYF